MSASAGIPGVPTAALDAITDENARIVLRAIVDGWQVRNGSTGGGNNRFVTAGELGQVGGYRMVGGLTQTVQEEVGRRTLAPGEINRVISDLQASVMESALWKSLGERVELIGIDASVNATGLATEIQNRLNNDNAIVASTTTQFAVINGNVSALQTSQTTTANNVAALTSSVSTMQASVAGNTAAIQQESIVRANVDGLLSGQYTVKVDLNGHVSGFGLASTANNSTPFSEFIVRADRFAIGTPSVPDYAQYVNNYPDLLAAWYAAGQPDKEIWGYNHYHPQGQIENRTLPSKIEETVPFIVTTTVQTAGGRLVPPGVYMDNAFIANGSISSAKIGLAQVDTLVIQGNAVTQPEMIFAEGFQSVNVQDLGSGSNPGPIPPNTLNYSPVATISVNMGTYAQGLMAVMIMISYVPVNTSGGSWYTAYRLMESTGTVHFSGVGGVANNAASVALTSFGRAVVGQGTRTFTLQVAHYGDIRASGAGVREVRLMALGAKR